MVSRFFLKYGRAFGIGKGKREHIECSPTRKALLLRLHDECKRAFNKRPYEENRGGLKREKRRYGRYSSVSADFIFSHGCEKMAYTTPCAFIASATLMKPAMFAPATRSSPRPYSFAALMDASKIFFMMPFSFASTSSALQE